MLAVEIYTYIQGRVLGALLGLGGAANVARAAALVGSVAGHLTAPGPGRLVLRGEGTGDGGLFTGILVRYVALAAEDMRLPAATRATARRLVLDTAEALWAGRTVRAVGGAHSDEDDDGWLVFSTEPQRPAAETCPAGSAVGLSTQLQAWMVLEAAARIH